MRLPIGTHHQLQREIIRFAGHRVWDGVEIGSSFPPHAFVRRRDDIRSRVARRGQCRQGVAHRLEAVGVSVEQIARFHVCETYAVGGCHIVNTFVFLHIPFQVHLRSDMVEQQIHRCRTAGTAVKRAVVVAACVGVVVGCGINILEILLDAVRRSAEFQSQ